MSTPGVREYEVAPAGEYGNLRTDSIKSNLFTLMRPNSSEGSSMFRM